MNVQGFQKLTLLDFPTKTACTVFTGGCNLRCPFCHNASLVSTPTEYPSAEQDVFDYLKKRVGVLDGVAITGGEPLLQPDLKDFILRIREMGFLVKLDTNGFFPSKLKELLDEKLLDYVAMDIKAAPKNYNNACGTETDIYKVKESLSVLVSSGVDFELRTTAVKGIHTLDEFTEIATFIGNGKKYFIQKFVNSGNLLGTNCGAFTDEEMHEILKNVQKIIPEASLRGVE